MTDITGDPDFYALAAANVELHKAITTGSPTSSKADEILLKVFNIPNEQYSQDEQRTPDPTLLKLEKLMIQEFFSSPFVYRALEGPKAIRLLVLHPGHPLEPLRGTIMDSVINKWRYEAVSYTWSSDAKPCSILLDGCQMPITQSLYNALVRLRYWNSDRKLWADGLCINQSDNKEKGVQVALMPEIYTYAGKVLVHLGMQADGSELLPGLLERVRKSDKGRKRQGRKKTKESHFDGLLPLDEQAWKALLAFFNRPWFLRIWIVQEIVLAREVQFICGDWELKWGPLAYMAEKFDSLLIGTPAREWSHEFRDAQHGAASLALMIGLRLTRTAVAERLDHLRRDIESASPLTGPTRDRDREHIKNLSPDLKAKRDLIIKSCRENPSLFLVVERMLLVMEVIKPPVTPIIKLLGMFARNEATKPQDRLYALVGLAADINLEDFPPDYEETVAQTNARFGRILVKNGQGIDLLFHATKLSIELRYLSYPSWTPDWTRTRSMDRHWLKLGWAYSQYSGGFAGRVNSTTHVSLVEGAENLLKVSGFRLDRFANARSIVKLFENFENFSLEGFVPAAKQLFQRTEALLSGPPYLTGESWPEVQCRTLVANRLTRMEDSISDAMEQYEETKFKHIHIADMDQMKPMNSWASAWFDLVPEYSVCKTTKGYVGLVPEATCASDELFMLNGSELPFILRPIRRLPGCYHFVGGCYMHGLMKGEAWKHRKTLSDYFLI